jgi:C4-dicarboxylate-specific signal transduction histidine kinase
VELRLVRELPRVHGDSGELRQVFINLVNNAVAPMRWRETALQVTELQGQLGEA